MLNVFHLKYFCDACRAENMSEAARLNRVSHSAVSQAIKSLEAALDVKLVRHAKKHFELTTEGHLLFEGAEAVFNGLESLTKIGRSQERELSGPLRIGLSHSIGLGLASKPLASFMARHPGVEPSLLIGNSTELKRLLESREIEVGFGIEDGHFSTFERRKISDGQFVLVRAPGKEKLKLKRFIVGDKGLEVRELLARLREAKHTPEILTVQSWALTADLAEKSVGIGLIPDFLLKAHPRQLTRVHRDWRLPSYELFAFFRSQTNLSRNAQAFLEQF